MSSVLLRDIVLYSALVCFILYTMRINNMWGVSKATKKAKLDVKKAKELAQKQKSWLKALQHFEWVALNIGGLPTETKLKDMDYRIRRCRLNISCLEREWKPIEMYGLFKEIQLLGVFLAVICTLTFKNIIFLSFLIFLLTPLCFLIYAEDKIMVEDKELEQDFPDLFLLLYGRLLKGASIRLAPTLDDYIKSLDVMYNGKSHKVIRGFVVDLRNNIEVYGDDSMAVYKLRDLYRSSMVINFCNLARQSLNGVDNSDKLLAFKIELTQQKLEQMKLRAEKLVEKGQRSIIVIYIILAQFVILSWIAKLGTMGGI